MTPQPNRSKLLAGLLIGGGLFFLATNLGWLGHFANWLRALLFLMGGLAFLYLYYTDRSRWWALIPGFSLLGLGAAALLRGDIGGSFFLGLTGAGFAAVYLSERRRWWALIPAGSLFTLALVAWLEGAWSGFDAGWGFFLGLAATFGTLFSLPEGAGKQPWAIYPAFGALALVAMVSSGTGGWWLPLLIGLGALQWWGGHPPSGPPAPKES